MKVIQIERLDGKVKILVEHELANDDSVLVTRERPTGSFPPFESVSGVIPAVNFEIGDEILEFNPEGRNKS